MPHAYTKDQQAPRTLTQPLLCGAPSPQPLLCGAPSPPPLPGGEGLEQPAIGLFAELGGHHRRTRDLLLLRLLLGQGGLAVSEQNRHTASRS